MRSRYYCCLPVFSLLFSAVSYGAGSRAGQPDDQVPIQGINLQTAYVVSALAKEPSEYVREEVLEWALNYLDPWLMPSLVWQIQQVLLPPREDKSPDEKFRLVQALQYLSLRPQRGREILFEASEVLAQVALESRGLIATQAMLAWGLAIRDGGFSRLKANPALRWATDVLLGEPVVPGGSFGEEALLGAVELIDLSRNTRDGARWLDLAKKVFERRGSDDLVGDAAKRILRRAGCGPGMARLGNPNPP